MSLKWTGCDVCSGYCYILLRISLSEDISGPMAVDWRLRSFSSYIPVVFAVANAVLMVFISLSMKLLDFRYGAMI